MTCYIVKRRKHRDCEYIKLSCLDMYFDSPKYRFCVVLLLFFYCGHGCLVFIYVVFLLLFFQTKKRWPINNFNRVHYICIVRRNHLNQNLYAAYVILSHDERLTDFVSSPPTDDLKEDLPRPHSRCAPYSSPVDPF